MEFTFTIDDPDDAERLKEDLRRDRRIYTRTLKTNGQNNAGKQFRLSRIRVDNKPLSDD